jgi:hypothetical protein
MVQPERPAQYALSPHPVLLLVLEAVRQLENVGTRRGAAADGLIGRPRIRQESRFFRAGWRAPLAVDRLLAAVLGGLIVFAAGSVRIL